MLNLSFSIVEQFRPFALVAPGFEQVEDVVPLRVSALHRTSERPTAPFVAIELDVVEMPRSGMRCGLFGDDGDFVSVGYDAAAAEMRIEVGRPGAAEVLEQQPVELRAPFRLAFVLCENQVTGLTDTGDGWEPVLTAREKVSALIDMRDPTVLGRYAFGYGPGGDGEPLGVEHMRAGHFGMTGLRDPHLVQRPDGSALIRDGKAYLTFTCAGLGFFQQAHWGVFTLDLAEPNRLEQVAQLYFRRDGLVLGDHAGQVVIDADGGRSIVANSSWGDFAFDGVHVRHTTTDDDVLTGAHVLETEPLALPTSVSAWDPGLTRIDDRWHIGFVESPSQDPFDFHPALAVAEPAGDYSTGLRLVGADESVHQCEGPILHRLHGEWHLLASDGDRHEYRVYDLSMRFVGTLQAPYPTNIPHPQIVDLPGGGHLMVTFNGTQYGESVLGYGGHGDVIVMRSASTDRG